MLSIGLAMAAMGQAGSQAEEESLVKVVRVASHRAIRPGELGRIGVILEPKEGWHIYWVNPGDTGIPTSLSWRVPGAVSLGRTIFPHPEQIPGQDSVSYGYGTSTMIVNRIQVSSRARPGQTLTLRGRVEWLACKEACIAGGEDVSLQIPVRRQLQLTPYAPTLRQADIDANRSFPGRLSAQRSGRGVVLRMTFGHSGQGVNSARFFPSSPSTLSHVQAPRLSRRGEEWSLELDRSEFSQQLPSRLSGTLDLQLPQGRRQYRVEGLMIQPSSGTAPTSSTSRTSRS